MDDPVIRVLDGLQGVDASSWNALIFDGNPFISHEFLSALERTGCLRGAWGWTPEHVTLWHEDRLLAAAPGYRKTNSHGEFVFDHAWAHAYARHRDPYYPKWLGAVPYSPVTGPRLLARAAADRQALAQAVVGHVQGQALSGAHLNFLTEEDADALADDWLARIDLQYHWENSAGWQTFEDFLGAMDHKHRKAIRQERRKVRDAGVTFRWLDGHAASDDDLAVMHRFYRQTFADYGNAPALTCAFMSDIARTMPDNLLIILAMQAETPIAGAFCLRDAHTLYGRYWGSDVRVPGLHFETCYYQGIAYCLAHGLRRFEPGAQGDHKIDRGFLPRTVHSRHWIADPAYRAALRDWCAAEAASVRAAGTALAAHSPFRRTA